ncbi:hypothetical protein PV10_00781 [Exophiala mesophila]|uniref:PHD-type domain-containing protein n=1 Tax=Exophiala mesophila TaxID=212818 RepID=A0A0D1Y8D8_EXOME|nr:uncharacterized protein PV10_00781 [Exophiala mesophila]KIV96971.1 hypothetical protein PV10_00781 [Exophiala mesophila]
MADATLPDTIIVSSASDDPHSFSEGPADPEKSEHHVPDQGPSSQISDNGLAKDSGFSIAVPSSHSQPNTSEPVVTKPSIPSSISQLDGAAPQPGAFFDHLPNGHTLPGPIAPELEIGQQSAPLVAPDQATSTQLENRDVMADSGLDLDSSAISRTESSVPKMTFPEAELKGDSESPLPIAYTDALTPTPNSQIVARGNNQQYTLSDGTVVSGKGLGRGRPGVKRGPRTSKPDNTDAARQISQQIPASGKTAPRGQKRKRQKSDDGGDSILGSTTPDSRESSEEYNPTATQTRSGRPTGRPVTLGAMTASPASRPKVTESPAKSSPSTPSTFRNHPKIRRRVYRGKEQSALCEHCLRGHGPVGNVIVFCDACNKCWHQRCHQPQISKETVTDTNAEWFCAGCARILNKGKKGSKAEKLPAVARPVLSTPAPAPTYVYRGPRVGGRFLSPAQKSAYLSTLSKDRLISLVLDASHLAPDLPMFETLVSTHPPLATEAQFTSTYVTPVTGPPPTQTTPGASGGQAEDEGYDGYFDEHAALYPKPGFGVKLPPEKEDMHMLLEGRDCRTFSHWVRGMAGREYHGTSSQR